MASTSHSGAHAAGAGDAHVGHHHAVELKPEMFDYKHVGGRFLMLAGGGVLALLVCFIWGYFNPSQFAHSYLFGFYFFFTICMGGLFWTLVHHAVDAEWSVVVRRQMENIGSLLWVMAVLFIPLIVVHRQLWHWFDQPPGVDPLLDEKRGYLNPTFFWIRCAFYFGFFTLASSALRRNSVKQDAAGAAKYTVFNRKITFASLPLFAVCLTFAAIDYLMGLNYHWFSTMWGVYIFAGTALSSMCVLVLIITAIRSAGYLQNVVTLEHYHVMGKLMFAFTVFWAYIGFSQYMLIWYANIPEETVWFLRRTTETWWYLSQFLVVGHFFVPFLLLLPQPTKRKPMFLCGVAVWILIMHFMDLYVVVLPELHKAGVQIHVLDFLCPLAIGCILAAVFLKRLGDVSLFPVRDPRINLSVHLKN